MKITVSGLPPKEVVQEISSFLNIKDKPSVIMQRSADPPSIIQIIGNVIDWLDPFKVAAIAFIAKLSGEVAKDVYKNKIKILKALELITVKPIREFVELISRSAKSTNFRNTQLFISINIPDDYFGTSLELKLNSAEELAWQFTNFIFRLEKIESILEDLMKLDKPPMAPINLIMNEDGTFIIKYMDTVDLEMHEVIVN